MRKRKRGGLRKETKIVNCNCVICQSAACYVNFTIFLLCKCKTHTWHTLSHTVLWVSCSLLFNVQCKFPRHCSSSVPAAHNIAPLWSRHLSSFSWCCPFNHPRHLSLCSWATTHTSLPHCQTSTVTPKVARRDEQLLFYKIFPHLVFWRRWQTVLGKIWDPWKPENTENISKSCSNVLWSVILSETSPRTLPTSTTCSRWPPLPQVSSC